MHYMFLFKDFFQFFSISCLEKKKSTGNYLGPYKDDGEKGKIKLSSNLEKKWREWVDFDGPNDLSCHDGLGSVLGGRCTII